MPARGSYRKMSETDRARALGCGNPGSSGSISNEPPDFYQDQTALQANRLFKNRPPSGRPRVTTRAQDRYINNIVARNRFAPASETHRRLYAASQESRPVSIQTVQNHIYAGGFKSRVPGEKPELTQRHGDAHLNFSRTNARWNNSQRRRVMFSDESSFT